MTVLALALVAVALLAGVAVTWQALNDAARRRWPAARGPFCPVPGCLHRAGHLGAHESESGRLIGP